MADHVLCRYRIMASYGLIQNKQTEEAPTMICGALDGGSPMWHVEFQKWLCQMSLYSSSPMSPLKCCYVACRIKEMLYVMSLFFLAVSISLMSHVDFKKWLYRCVEFRGQEPYILI